MKWNESFANEKILMGVSMRSNAETVPTLVLERVVASTPQKIFDLWTQPKLMARWMSPYPGVVACEAAADVRVGGAYKLSMESAGSSCEIEGTYIEVDPPTKLVFTWCGPPTAGANTLVTLNLKPLQTGTKLTLTHEKLPTTEVRQGHAMGWANMLDHLSGEVE
jgi:uncharacterized protein YndB with AHSA1/START domain